MQTDHGLGYNMDCGGGYWCKFPVSEGSWFLSSFSFVQSWLQLELEVPTH